MSKLKIDLSAPKVSVPLDDEPNTSKVLHDSPTGISVEGLRSLLFSLTNQDQPVMVTEQGRFSAGARQFPVTGIQLHTNEDGSQFISLVTE